MIQFLSMKEVREARIKAGITQQEIAVEASMSVSYYTRLENGMVGNPTIGTLKKIEKALAYLTSTRRRERK